MAGKGKSKNRHAASAEFLARNNPGLDIEKDSSASISCDTYQCQVDFEDNDIISLNAKPLANGNSSCPNISIYVTQWL